MNKNKIYISGILTALLFNACSSEDQITKDIEDMQEPQSSYTQEKAEDTKKIVENTVTEKNDLRALLIDKQYYITLKDKGDNINHYSWKFEEDSISSTKLNGYSTTTKIPYQINENILSVSIDDQSKIFTFEAEDSDYLILEDNDEDIRLYHSVEKSDTFFATQAENSSIADKPIVEKSELSKEIEGNKFFLGIVKDAKKALFKLSFEEDGMVTIQAISGYTLSMSISYYVENNILKFNSDSRVFDSNQGDYLLFTDNSRMYKSEANAKIYLDDL